LLMASSCGFGVCTHRRPSGGFSGRPSNRGTKRNAYREASRAVASTTAAAEAFMMAMR
jgi:hypothetical protein